MESGADDLPLSAVPSSHTPAWTAEAHGCATASPDVNAFLVRERRALALFLEAWAGAEGGAPGEALRARARAHRAAGSALEAAMGAVLWVRGGGGAGYWGAYNAKARAPVLDRTYQMAWPAWAGIGSGAQSAACLAEVLSPDMRGAFGIRSTSAAHPRYSTEDAIAPYSIWRGPVWINVNCCLAYALARAGLRAEAAALAQSLVAALAADLRRSGAMHECYHPDSGAPTCSASKGFLSWNMLAAELLHNLERGVDPTALEG